LEPQIYEGQEEEEGGEVAAASTATMKDTKTPFCCSKLPWVSRGIPLKTVNNLDVHSQNVSPSYVSVMT
jgi:hypothetical protein